MFEQSRHHRRRTTQIPASGTHQVHERLPHLFAGYSPAANKYENDSVAEDEDALSSDEDEERLHRHSTGSSFLASAARTYSRAMYAHTTSQIAHPGTSTLPNYNRTMHAFTLNQLNHMDNTGSHNPTSLRNRHEQQKISPPKVIPGPNSSHKSHIPAASPLALKLPPSQHASRYLSRSLSTLNQMSLDEEPCGPSNTPEPDAPALAPAPTSTASLSSAEMLAEGRVLVAKFEELMAGMNGQGVGGLKAEARDFAAVGLI